MSAFERMDLAQFDGFTAAEWYEEVDQYDEEGELETPMPNGDVYEACEDGAHIAQVYKRNATAVVVNAPRFLAALRAAYAEIDRLRANALEWVTVTDDLATLPKGIGAVILVLVGEEWWHQASLGANGDVRRWRLASGKWERLSVGDRWTYIPKPTEVL